MMCILTLLVLLVLLMAAPAGAAPGDVAGRWAVRSHGRVLMIVDVARDRAGWHGRWVRALYFQADEGWDAECGGKK